MRRLALLTLLLPSLAFAKPVALTSKDGTSLHAEVSGAGARGVILLHGEGSNAATWNSVREQLATHGYQVLALDLRGCGTSKGTADEAGWAHSPEDVAAALAWLKAHGSTKVALLGTEGGGVVALQSAVGQPMVDSVIVLSPRLSAPGLKVSAAIEAYGAHPLLIVTGSTDTTGVRAAAALEPRALGLKRVELVENGGIGAVLFNQSSTLEGTVVQWLADGGPTPEDHKAESLRTAAPDDLETTGTRYGQ